MQKVNNVVSSGMCAGCGLCASSAAQMKIDDHGFARPNEQIIDSISTACPSLSVSHLNQEAPYNDMWGPVITCERGFALDEDIRHRGSSGGLITALLVYLLDSKKVDGVIQIGGSEINPIRNETFVNETRDAIIQCAGSRYAPSSPLEKIRGLVNNGKRYALVGKPCDVAAVRRLIADSPEFKKQYPFLISFMCAGIPSESGTEDILKHLGVSQTELSMFRYRGDGWPGLTKASTKLGKDYTMTYNESWGNILNRKLQARCKLCADGIGEAADIVCGDAWYSSENGYPSFEEQEGYSLALARTKVGRKLLDEAVDAGYISLSPFDINTLEEIQPYQKNRKITSFARRIAALFFGRLTPKYNGYKLFKLSIVAGIRVNIKAFIGTLVRCIQGRL